MSVTGASVIVHVRGTVPYKHVYIHAYSAMEGPAHNDSNLMLCIYIHTSIRTITNNRATPSNAMYIRFAPMPGYVNW